MLVRRGFPLRMGRTRCALARVACPASGFLGSRWSARLPPRIAPAMGAAGAARSSGGIDANAIPGVRTLGFNAGMDHTPPSPAHGRASLAAALDRVDAALAEPGLDWSDTLASLGVWGAWLRWMLRLLAFEFALAGGEPCQIPGAAAGSGRQLSPKALDRKIDRLIEAAARLWNTDEPASARPRRRRWRRLLQLILRWHGALHRRFRAAFVAVHRVRSAPVLALCKPDCRSGADSHHQPHRGSARLEAPGRSVACSGPARGASTPAPSPSSSPPPRQPLADPLDRAAPAAHHPRHGRGRSRAVQRSRPPGAARARLTNQALAAAIRHDAGIAAGGPPRTSTSPLATPARQLIGARP